MECLTNEQWISIFDTNQKVLLVNPPVQEIRYAWQKWNQPTELLLLSNKLKSEVGCETNILDFMLPDENGRVTTKDVNQRTVYGTNYKNRLYGSPVELISANLKIALKSWKPTHVVLYSMTSYWYEAITRLIPIFKTLMPQIRISIIGAYPIVETERAKKSNADYLVIDSINYHNNLPDYEIYFNNISRILNNNRVISFGGLKYTATNQAENLIKQIESLEKIGINNFVIFENDIFIDDCSILQDFCVYIDKRGKKVNLHGICGLNPSKAKEHIYKLMLKSGYRSFFFDYDVEETTLNIDNYRKIHYELIQSNNIRKVNSGSLAGFIMVGTPNDQLENMFEHCFNILETCGSIIPKPFTPNPGTQDYLNISSKGLQYLSPHVFPMAEYSGISREQYREFYQHTTFLNEKRMGVSFNYFDNSHTVLSLKESLKKKVGLI